MKRIFTLLAAVVAASILLWSCGKDDSDEPGSGSGSSLVINGEKAGTVYNAECTASTYHEDWGDEYATGFYLQFAYNGDMTVFSVGWPVKRSKLKAGMNLMDIETPDYLTFRGLTTIEIDPYYDEFSGNVYVESITDSAITLKFENFSFHKSLGNRNYTISGKMTYTIK